MIDGECQTYVSDCHVRSAVELVAHTWDAVLLSALRVGPTRRTTLLTRVRGLSDKVLTESLRRLVDRGLVVRRTGDEAYYALTGLGESFATGPLAQLAQWAAEHQDELLDASPS